MKKLASTLLVTATLVGTVGAACAQYGSGYYGPGPYYGGRYYDDGRYYRRGYGYGGAIIGYDSFSRQQLNFPVGPGGRCPRHYTVQNGLCKPYPYRGAYY
jgi:hypothetical protein